MRIAFPTILTLIFAASLASCATPPTFGESSGVELTDLEQLPQPADAALYKIGGQEILDITVVGSDLLSSKFITDGAGSIDYPLVGNVNLAGLSPNAASRVIADRLRGRYVLNPQVIVIPDELSEVTFSVGGEVDRPGNYPASASTTLMRAINAAGGLDEFADRERVAIFRNVEGQRYIGVYDLSAIQQGNYPDPKVFAQDVVMVGDSPGERRFERILQLVPVLSTAVILIDRIGR